MFQKGDYYSREEIRNLLGGGDTQSFLPQKNGKAIAGCFDRKKNKSAPTEIDVGAGIKVEKTARALVESGHAIPVFIKHAPKVWEYVGFFRATSFSTRAHDLRQPHRRHNAVAVFYLEELLQDSASGSDAFDPTSAFSEGRKILKMHYQKERSRELVIAKKNTFKNQHGMLFC